MRWRYILYMVAVLILVLGLTESVNHGEPRLLPLRKPDLASNAIDAKRTERAV